VLPPPTACRPLCPTASLSLSQRTLPRLLPSRTLGTGVRLDFIHAAYHTDSLDLTGIKVSPNTTYTGSFYAKSSSYAGTIVSSLQSAAGATSSVVYASAEVVPSGEVVGTWTKYNFDLITGTEGAPDIENVFTITLVGGAEATIQFGLFTLFPPTYKDRPNGLRKVCCRAIF